MPPSPVSHFLTASGSRTRQPWFTGLLLALFVLVGAAHFRNSLGDDLGSSYVGCRLIATGHPGSLFAFDPENFAAIGPDPFWPALAHAGGDDGFLHPYVQTPLWGYSLQPLCDHTGFRTFSRVFAVLILLCFAASLWLIARFWAPLFLRPVPMAAALLLLWFSQPFGYAMFLLQTHALFFLLTIAALILAERERPIAAGALLALAAAVKITPILFVLYWLLTRRYRAAASAVLTSGLLTLLTVLAVGPALTAAYLADLHRISGTLLVAMNNQSFAAFVMGRFYSPDEIFDVNALPLPAALRLGSEVLVVALTLLGGWMDRRRLSAPASLSLADGGANAPFGAMVALIGLTFFAPIAWTHYTVILIAPLMLLVAAIRGTSLRDALSRPVSLVLSALVVVAIALNYPPLAGNVITMDVGRFALVRAQFYAAVLCILGLALASRLRPAHSHGSLAARPAGVH